MSASSAHVMNTSADIRNCVGYAIRQIQAAQSMERGFTEISQRPTSRKSHMLPHRSIHGTRRRCSDGGNTQAQWIFDLFYTSGLTNNLPAMIPVTMLYGTPEDAARRIAYIEKRLPIGYIEMGKSLTANMLYRRLCSIYLQWLRPFIRLIQP